MQDLHHFRDKTREWLEKNCPQSMRKPMLEKDKCWGGRNFVFQSDDQALWLERMSAVGWTAPAWPKSYGGGGLNSDQVKILREEMMAIKARAPLSSMGIGMMVCAAKVWF